MEKEQVINKIVSLPQEFHFRNNTSMLSLLRETRYFEAFNEIDVDDIEKALKNRHNFVQDWLQLSEDKRTRTGWFFKRHESNRHFVVGFASNGVQMNVTEFANIYEACAYFIKMEIEDIRENAGARGHN